MIIVWSAVLLCKLPQLTPQDTCSFLWDDIDFEPVFYVHSDNGESIYWSDLIKMQHDLKKGQQVFLSAYLTTGQSE